MGFCILTICIACIVQLLTEIMAVYFYLLQLRILWCPSPYATAELFEELKVSRINNFPYLYTCINSVIAKCMANISFMMKLYVCVFLLACMHVYLCVYTFKLRKIAKISYTK